MTETDDYNKQLIILLSLLRAANEKFEVNFNENQIEKVFDSQIVYRELVQNLILFGEAKIISYIYGGEDDCDEFFEITIVRENYLKYIQDIYSKLYSEFKLIYTSQAEKLKDIYNFSPENVVAEINESKQKLNEIIISIGSSEYLKPLQPKIDEISKYLEKTENVIKNYENIYLNIIKPIKKESKQGIIATAIWAILGIIITAILSFYFSYKSITAPLTNNGKQVTSDSIIHSNLEMSSLERKVDFLTREYLGMNDKFQVKFNEVTIKGYDKCIVYTSAKDTISLDLYSFNDYENKNICYSNVDLRFYLNRRLISSQMLNKIFKLKSSLIRENSSYNYLSVIEGDTIVFNGEAIVIKKIFSKNSKCVPIGDEYNGITIIKLNNNR